MSETPESDLTIPRDKPIVLFDGVCNLCNGFVQFLIRVDPSGKFRFASLQSEAGEVLLQEGRYTGGNLESVVLFDAGRIYTHSDAALEISRRLGGFWTVLYALKLIPWPLRDRLYNWIARNRYRWFGKKDQCMMPSPELKQRFI